jgi:hypothetical protein
MTGKLCRPLPFHSLARRGGTKRDTPVRPIAWERWNPPVGLATYSHSIINGSCKPLIRLVDASNRAGFTVRCTATSSGIPSRSFHHRSTSIENSRRFHNTQLSRSIEIYRVFARDFSGVSGVAARREVIKEASASNDISCCRIASLWQFFYRHAAAAVALHVSAHPSSAPWLPSTA